MPELVVEAYIVTIMLKGGQFQREERFSDTESAGSIVHTITSNP